eukprot:gene3668-6482_t
MSVKLAYVFWSYDGAPTDNEIEIIEGKDYDDLYNKFYELLDDTFEIDNELEDAEVDYRKLKGIKGIYKLLDVIYYYLIDSFNVAVIVKFL